MVGRYLELAQVEAVVTAALVANPVLRVYLGNTSPGPLGPTKMGGNVLQSDSAFLFQFSFYTRVCNR